MRNLCNVESAVATCDSYNFDTSNLRKSTKKKKPKHHCTKLRRFTSEELESATNGFSPRSFLGKGSHASVFLAALDGGALTAAVKRTTASVASTAENEVEILSKIWSRRIVNLLGYAVDSSPLSPAKKHLLLVVEYMPNGSLYDHIHKNPKPPTWSNRVRLALQISKAVQSLHGSSPPIIHRDIKSSNVLIDDCGRARLSDFGLALRGHVEDMRVTSTPPAGTLGYLDPGYLAPSDVSTKSDVFSFGILLLEIVSGRKAIDVNYSPPSIVEWGLPLIRAGNYQGICDRRIRGPTDPTVCRELALLAARCVRSRAEKRPNMTEVVECLKVVYRRARGAPIWNNIRRRVGHTERSSPLIEGGFDGSDGEERCVKTTSLRQYHGNRRTLSGRSRKVSSVASPEQSMVPIEEVPTRGGRRVGRSKSVGSAREIKVEGEVKKKAQVTVKKPIVTLSKSRSTSVLHSRSGDCKNSGIQLQQVKVNPQIKEVDVLQLLLNSRINQKQSHR